MATIVNAKDFLRKKLIPNAGDPAKVFTWLLSLGANILDAVFCINLYMDLKMGYLDESTINEILEKMPGNPAGGKEPFGKFVEDNQDRYLCINLTGPQTLDPGDIYIRVLELDSAITYYLQETYYITCDEEGRKEAIDRFFKPPPGKTKESLEKVRAVWRGRMNNVWVTRMTALKDAISRLGDTKIADYVNDALALEYPEGAILVFVKYPKGFKDSEFRKPTTPDAHWYHHRFFLSICSDNGWGKTCSMNPAADGFPERVHKGFKGLSAGFEGDYIGKISDPAEPDLDHLLREAERRS